MIESLTERKKLELQRRQLFLECSNGLRKASLVDAELKLLVQMDVELNTETYKAGRFYHQKLCYLRELVENFKLRVTDIKNRRSTETSIVQDILKQIEDFIRVSRTEQNETCEALCREETALRQACLLSEKRINWMEQDTAKTIENSFSRTTRQSMSVSLLDTSKVFTPEIVELKSKQTIIPHNKKESSDGILTSGKVGHSAEVESETKRFAVRWCQQQKQPKKNEVLTEIAKETKHDEVRNRQCQEKPNRKISEHRTAKETLELRSSVRAEEQHAIPSPRPDESADRTNSRVTTECGTATIGKLMGATSCRCTRAVYDSNER